MEVRQTFKVGQSRTICNSLGGGERVYNVNGSTRWMDGFGNGDGDDEELAQGRE